MRNQVDMCVFAHIHTIPRMSKLVSATFRSAVLNRSVISFCAGAKFVVEKPCEVENLPGLEQIIELFLGILPQSRSKPLHEPIKSFLKVLYAIARASAISEY
jgi:hypothetical protein